MDKHLPCYSFGGNVIDTTFMFQFTPDSYLHNVVARDGETRLYKRLIVLKSAWSESFMNNRLILLRAGQALPEISLCFIDFKFNKDNGTYYRDLVVPVQIGQLHNYRIELMEKPEKEFTLYIEGVKTVAI